MQSHAQWPAGSSSKQVSTAQVTQQHTKHLQACGCRFGQVSAMIPQLSSMQLWRDQSVWEVTIQGRLLFPKMPCLKAGEMVPTGSPTPG